MEVAIAFEEAEGAIVKDVHTPELARAAGLSNPSHPCMNSDGTTDVLDPGSSKSVLTYSALNTFRNCPRKYKHRYVDSLRPRERPEALSFGSIIHGAIELWYQSPADDDRLWTVLDYIDQQFPERVGDEACVRAHVGWFR